LGVIKNLLYDDTDTNEKIRIFYKGVAVPPYYDTYGVFIFSYTINTINSSTSYRSLGYKKGDFPPAE